METLSNAQISQFIQDGFIRIDFAFSRELAAECRSILWRATGCDPEDPATWREPVIRLGEIGLEPFRKAANTPVLQNAFNQLVGEGRWIPRETVGSFPIRFPGCGSASDTGWHVDASFPGEEVTDFMQWRINFQSKGRALLMLFLFSDVSDKDAPTRIRRGSHLSVAKMLYPAGEKGLSFGELAKRLENLPPQPEVVATGSAGTVYLCHPFLAHAAQDHYGLSPKFMAQPALIPKGNFNIFQEEKNWCSIEKAIHTGIFN